MVSTILSGHITHNINELVIILVFIKCVHPVMERAALFEIVFESVQNHL